MKIGNWPLPLRISNWEVASIGNTPEVRGRRLVEMAKECQDAGFNVNWTYGAIDPQKLIENMLRIQNQDSFYVGNVEQDLSQ